MSEINLIDVEASGLHFESYPIEVGVRVNGIVQSWLIRPTHSWTHWDDAAESLHKLSRERLHLEGLPPERVARELNSLFSETACVVYSDAAPWDDDWIKTLFAASGQKPAFVVLPITDLLDQDASGRFQRRLAQLREANHSRLHRVRADLEQLREAYRHAIESS